MYRNGHGVKQNYPEAIRLYSLAADQGDAFAEYNLALLYEKGEGVKKNIKKAIFESAYTFLYFLFILFYTF